LKRLAPFDLVEGRLRLEGLDLGDIAASLDGRPAWVIGASAVRAAAARGAGARGGPVTVAVSAVGPPAALALLAEQGCWAQAASRHELLLAQQAGFPAGRIAAHAPVLDDGFLVEALSAPVAVLVRSGREAERAVERIARALGLDAPPARGAPPVLPASAFGRCGGLLARLLSAGPPLALDAATELRGSPLIVPVSGASAASLRPGSPSRRSSLRELSGRPARPATVISRPQRGDWVLVRTGDALAARASHPAWPAPRSVLVGGGLWRLLDPRPLPAGD
jgi:hypothetical protein